MSKNEVVRDTTDHFELSKTKAAVFVVVGTLLSIAFTCLASKAPDSKAPKNATAIPEPTPQITVIPEAPSLPSDITIKIPKTATLDK